MSISKAAVSLAVLILCGLALGGEPEPVSTPGTFRFSGGERIRLIVYPKEVGDSFEQFVYEDGYIVLPTGGKPLLIRNKTIVEAQQLATERIEKDSKVLNATASIALLGVPTRSVYVGGEGIKVNQTITFTSTAPLTLYAAILAAGGVAPDGDPTRVSVSHTTPEGTIKTTFYDVSKFGERNNSSVGPILESGDLVKVPRGEVFLLAGEVFKTGPANRRELSVAPDRPVRLSTLLYGTGGLKSGANRRKVTILRLTKDGKRVTFYADLDAPAKSEAKAPGAPPPPGRTNKPAATPAPVEQEADKAEGENDPALADGDIVVVGPTGGVAVLGKVRNPNIYPTGGAPLKLSRVIAMAGGFAEFAKPSAIQVIKASNPGTIIHIDMNFNQKGGFQDPELDEGDLVFVPERLL